LDSISVNLFEILWNDLIEKYFNDDTNNYLSRNLYNIRDKWGWYWKKQIMTAGVKTTSRLEGYHSTIKKQLNSNSSLVEVFEKIENDIQKTEKNKINSWYKSKNVNCDNTILDIFEDIFANVKKYLSNFCQSLIKIEMMSSCFYQSDLSSPDELCNDNNGDNIINDNINNERKIDTIDVRSFSLQELLSESEEQPLEIWKLNHYKSKKNQYIVIFADGSYVCTCMLLSNRGIVCRHFFEILKKSKFLKFHISVIARRWFKEELREAQLENEYILSSNCVRTHEEPKPFVETFGESSRRFLKVNPPAIIKDKKKDFGYIAVFDKFRKITNFADKDEKKYQLLNKALEEVYTKLTKEEEDERDEKDDDVIKNPLKAKTKGRTNKKILQKVHYTRSRKKK